jgi:hypothetical protein
VVRFLEVGGGQPERAKYLTGQTRVQGWLPQGRSRSVATTYAGCSRSYVVAITHATDGGPALRWLSLRPEEAPRFNRMVERLAGGSPTEFIRKELGVCSSTFVRSGWRGRLPQA